MEVNAATQELLEHMTAHQSPHLIGSLVQIEDLLFPSKLGSFIMGELTVLTANTLIRMYGGLPGEWLIISVCHSKNLQRWRPPRLNRQSERDTDRSAGSWSCVVSNHQRTAKWLFKNAADHDLWTFPTVCTSQDFCPYRELISIRLPFIFLSSPFYVVGISK